MSDGWDLEGVRTYWDAVADRYLDLFRDELRGKPYDLALLERFAADLGPGARVCDAGCGPCGHVTRVLADRGLQVVGTDLSPKCVALARREQPGLRFEVEDTAALAFGDGSLDGLVSYYGLHYEPLSRVRATLREFARVLRPRGRLLVVAKEGAGEGWIDDPMGTGRAVFWCGFTAGGLRQLIEECGFDVLDCETRAPLTDEIPARRLSLSAERV